MRTPSNAARTVLAAIRPLPTERLPLGAVLDRVIARDVESPIDLPAWDNSAMDGYAVRAADVAPGAELQVVETIPAGAFPTRPVAAGECARIFTGAPLPDGADTVIRQEDTTSTAAGMRIDDPRDAGRNVRRRGEDIRRGSVVLEAGTALGPAQIGVLASIAQSEVDVHRTPVVAYMGSGDEIADLDERDAILAGRKIASSNSYTIDAMIRRAGAVPLNLGIARDDPADIARRLEGARDADLLVTSAGISVGEHDHLRTVLESLGGTLTFWRIRMRPGAPVGFGTLFGTTWLGLPGNPVSTMVTFELFARAAIRRMQGHRRPFRRTRRVVSADAMSLGPPLTHFQRAVVSEEGDRLVARLTGAQGSGILTSMAQANALLVVPVDRREVRAGDTLRAILLDDPVHVESPDWEEAP